MSGRALGQPFTTWRSAVVMVVGIEIPTPDVFVLLCGLAAPCTVFSVAAVFGLSARES